MRMDKALTTYKKLPVQMEHTLITAFTLKYLGHSNNSISEGKLSNFKKDFEAILGMIESWIDPE